MYNSERWYRQIITYIVLQLCVILLAAPFVNGVIKKVKALSQKRKGAPLFQQYYDLFKLLHKTVVISDVSSWIFKATPYLFFSTSLVAALMVPVTTKIMPNGICGDAILLVSVLALGRFFMMLAALDTASTFGGMGSSREAMISSLIEPSILVALITIGLTSGSTSIPNMMNQMNTHIFPLTHPVYMMIFLAMLVIILAETARIPVDDPTTHLELTMVHEAMVLEYSGRHLALMEYGAAVKQMVLITLLMNLLMPTDQFIVGLGVDAIFFSLLVFVIKVLLLAILIALVEVNTVKVRLFTIPNLAALSFILSFLGFLQQFVLGGSHV